MILNNDPTILSQPSFSVNVSALTDFVKLKVQWWVNTSEAGTSSSMSTVQEQVIQSFAENSISIVYPVQQVKGYGADAALSLPPSKRTEQSS